MKWNMPKNIVKKVYNLKYLARFSSLALFEESVCAKKSSKLHKIA